MNFEKTVSPQASVQAWADPALSNLPAVESLERAKVNILLVDDRQDKLLALEAVLSGLNENLVKAHSGKEALRYLLHQDFAVILLDVSMPEMDGFQTAALIRKRVHSEHTPIIFITSIQDTQSHISKGYSLGAVDYMLTPIVPAVLQTKVSVFVDLYRKTEQVKAQAERLRQIEEAQHRRQLAEATDRLEAETKRNRFFNLSIDLLAIADFDGYFRQLNPTWEKTLGYTTEELKAIPFQQLVHPDDQAAMTDQCQRLQQDSPTTYFENRCRCKDGSFRWLGWTAAPFVAERLVYIFARDITARKQAEEEIRHLNKELKQRVVELTDVNKELESFTYSISHDLRAPLRSMQSFAGALLEECSEQISAEGKDFARRIFNSARYMDTLLQDLLNYSRLAQSELDLLPINLDAALTEVLAQLDKEVQDKQAQVEIQRPLSSLLAHLPTLKQILTNLLCNAVKFMEPGRTPRIQIWTDRGTNMVRLWVEDNGIGIANEHQERIFGLFQRLHTYQTYPGTGVGLAIVRKGVERMGGRVGVESRPGEGSRFWIELPTAIRTEHAQHDSSR